MQQTGPNHILIFGGYNLKTFRDSYLFLVKEKKVKSYNMEMGAAIWPFQMPVVFDCTCKKIYTADYTNERIFSMDMIHDGQFRRGKDLR